MALCLKASVELASARIVSIAAELRGHGSKLLDGICRTQDFIFVSGEREEPY